MIRPPHQDHLRTVSGVDQFDRNAVGLGDIALGENDSGGGLGHGGFRPSMPRGALTTRTGTDLFGDGKSIPASNELGTFSAVFASSPRSNDVPASSSTRSSTSFVRPGGTVSMVVEAKSGTQRIGNGSEDNTAPALWKLDRKIIRIVNSGEGVEWFPGKWNPSTNSYISAPSPEPEPEPA
jgi:hypothetical protein